MVDIYTALPFERRREQTRDSLRREEEAFYQAYREPFWIRLRRCFASSPRHETSASPENKVGCHCLMQPAE